MLDITTILTVSILSIFTYMVIAFLISQLLKDNGLVDIFWGIGFIVIAIILVQTIPLVSDRLVLITGLTMIWGVRISGYILIRKVVNKKEDWRYAKWRSEWGNLVVIRSFLQIFMLQGLVILLLSTPLILTAANSLNPQPISSLDIIGISIWLIGLLIESIADWQKFRFKLNPDNHDKFITHGLWSISRHPNYFGELLVWFGIAIIGLSNQLGIIGLIGPLTILVVFWRVSIPIVEKKYQDSFHYSVYVDRTSKLIPWFRFDTKKVFGLNFGFRALVAFTFASFLLFLGSFTLWINNTGQPLESAQLALISDQAITVENSDYISFIPTAGYKTIGVIIYPGGLVDARSYAPLARLIAEEGYYTAITPMPFNLAVLDPTRGNTVISDYPDIRQWVIVGHSLGGTMASRFALDTTSVTGLVLLAAYPESSIDLSETSMSAVTIIGDQDGLVTVTEVQESLEILPGMTEFITITGGNHAQFGDYGAQRGDKAADLTPEQQWQITKNNITRLLARLETIR